MIKIAACQYRLDPSLDWSEYTQKIERLIQEAKATDAQLVLLPEYAGIEIAENNFDEDGALFSHLQMLLPQYLAFYQTLADQYGLYIQPGTIVAADSSHYFRNRAYFFGPNGKYHYQDKLHFVSSEKENNLLQPGEKQTLFKTALGAIGIAVCYDSEFPEVVSKLVQQGAMLILVPSYTPGIKSFHRVFYACRARAIENQCYIMMSCAVGNVKFSDSHHQLIGQANIFSPIDDGFPDDGILCQGAMNEVKTISGIISYEKLQHVRQYGQVRNFQDSLIYHVHQAKIEEIAL